MNPQLLPELSGHLAEGKTRRPPALSLSDLDQALAHFLVGTHNVRRYAKWDIAEPPVESWGPRDPSDEKVDAALARSRTVFYTPPVATAFAAFRKDLNQFCSRVEACIDQGQPSEGVKVINSPDQTS